jgi:hypothetical protein
MIRCNINVSKVDKQYLYEGKTGKFLEVTLLESKGGPDKYGNDGFIVQGVTKEARDRGERGPIIGSWKHSTKAPRPQGHPTGGTQPVADDLF